MNFSFVSVLIYFLTLSAVPFLFLNSFNWSVLKGKGKGIQVLYTNHLASTLCDPSPLLIRLNGHST